MLTASLAAWNWNVHNVADAPALTLGKIGTSV